MTLLEEPVPDLDAAEDHVDPSAQREPEATEDAAPVASSAVVGAAAFLAVTAAGWMFAGIFDGLLPRAAAVGASLLAVGGTVLSYRTRAAALLQYGVLAVVAGFGLLLVVSDLGDGDTIAGVVRDALRDGGIAHPPVPFDPGWRLLLVLLLGLVGVGATALAIGSNRPKLAVAVPGPLVFIGALVQPPGSAVVSTAIALGLLVAALVVAVGAETGGAGAAYETRRLARAGGVVALVLVALVGVSQLGFLFPDADDSQVIPPQRPAAPPPVADKVLFTVDAEKVVPIRLGTLDVYRDDAFLTPPFDPARQLEVGGRIMPLPNDFGVRPGEPTPLDAAADDVLEVTIHIEGMRGRVLPTPANPLAVERDGDDTIEYDPRTQGLRLPSRLARQGLTYTVVARPTPAAEELQRSGEPAPSLAEYLEVPTAPVAVTDVLNTIPADASSAFDRLQFVRNAYYQRVIAAGEGTPSDVTAARVGELLDGTEATPFEITAGEVLLARWVGVPARLGYGYYGGDRDDGLVSVRPKHAATWLEAYFEGSGWIPIIGTPPRAKASLSESQKNDDPSVRPTDELSLIAYAPVRLQSIQLLYEVVRYWVLRALVAVALLALGLFLLPGVVKAARRLRRSRWAARRGPAARLAVAYAELRDVAHDLNIGDPAILPLDFVAKIEADEEHAELAWLVSRGLWGDLARDLRDADADAGEELASSVLRRLRRAHTGLNRLLAFASRASLRRPYADDVPNLWPSRRIPRRWVALGSVAALVLAVLAVVAWPDGGSAEVAGRGMPEHVAPERLDRFRFVREESAEAQYDALGESSLVADAQVFSIHDADDIQGSFQVIELRDGFSTDERDVREGILSSIGGGRFQPTRLARQAVFELELPEQRIFLAFPNGGDLVEIFVARQGFADADEILGALFEFQRTGVAELDPSRARVTVLDPRRGGLD